MARTQLNANATIIPVTQEDLWLEIRGEKQANVLAAAIDPPHNIHYLLLNEDFEKPTWVHEDDITGLGWTRPASGP